MAVNLELYNASDYTIIVLKEKEKGVVRNTWELHPRCTHTLKLRRIPTIYKIEVYVDGLHLQDILKDSIKNANQRINISIST